MFCYGALMTTRFDELSQRLNALLDQSPADAIQEARAIASDTPDRLNLMSLKAAVLVNGGNLTGQQDAITEGLTLYRDLYAQFPVGGVAYNLGNALVAAAGTPPDEASWLGHQEQTIEQRAEARRLFWQASQDPEASAELVTQAWTNLANQFAGAFRLGEAHDARLEALRADPTNGVAAGAAALGLLWLYEQGGCSDQTKVEALLLAKIAARNEDRMADYAGQQMARKIKAFADKLPDPVPRQAHADPFIAWVERERLTLSPSVELVDPALGKIDWLTLPGIVEGIAVGDGSPPPIFAMFNVLKADFILARDLAWRALDEQAWPMTGRYADTLDYATYGPDASALVLAHRTALDLLDKVAVTANHHFGLGQKPDKVFFGRLWRDPPDKTTGQRPLTTAVKDAVRMGARALYGLVELADDYETKGGILRPQKDLRNAGTHRFVVLHDMGDPARCRQAPEVERQPRDQFGQEVLRALRVVRAAIQILALAIGQYEKARARQLKGRIGRLDIPDHDWVRRRDS